MKQLIFIMLAFLFPLHLTAQQEDLKHTAALDVTLDRREIHEGESFRFLIATSSSNQRPDTSPLEQDFYVLGTGFQSQVSIVNGRRSDDSKWVITLQARQAGSFEIPALTVGKQRTRPLSVTILPPVSFDSTSGSGGVPVAVELSIEDAQPYVQSKLVVTAKVWMDSTILGGSLTDPILEGALLERLGEDTSYNAKRDGKDYQVIERRYALFPQVSGSVIIPPVVFEGTRRIEQAGRRRPSARDPFFSDPFFNDPFFGGSPFGGLMQRGSPIRAQSESLQLEVLPKPAEAQSDWWLPAQKVELLEQWEPQSPTFQVGEPVTRNLVLRAVGLGETQIPELEMPRMPGCKIYPGAVQSRTLTIEDEVVSLTIQPIVIVPTQAGELTFPAMEIPWWDVRENVARVARLEEQTVEVLPGDGAAAISSVTPAASEQSSPPSEGEGSPPAGASPTEASKGGAIGWVFAGLTGLAGLLAGAYYWKRRSQSHNDAIPVEVLPSPREAEAVLKAACAANNPIEAHAAVLALGSTLWPTKSTRNTRAFARRFQSSQLETELELLETICFGLQCANMLAWNGQNLWRAYQQVARQQVPVARMKSSLPPLYPQFGESPMP